MFWDDLTKLIITNADADGVMEFGDLFTITGCTVDTEFYQNPTLFKKMYTGDYFFPRHDVEFITSEENLSCVCNS